jgi:hypothetical protein
MLFLGYACAELVEGWALLFSTTTGVLLSRNPFWLKKAGVCFLLTTLALGWLAAAPPPSLPRRETTLRNLAQASSVPRAMLLSCAGSCDCESRPSTLWQLSTAILLASSTSSII